MLHVIYCIYLLCGFERDNQPARHLNISLVHLTQFLATKPNNSALHVNNNLVQ